MTIDVELENGKYTVKAEMDEFGACAAYKFISNIITQRLNSGESVPKITEELMKYECHKGPDGCIRAIGKCIIEIH